MNQEKIGKFIAELRKGKKLTQTELAKRIGVSNKAVSKWETGNGIPDYGVFENLCNEFNITVNELLSGERNNKNDKVIGEYMKIKDKENRRKIILVVIISFLIILSSVLGVYFINSYDKTNMYLLSGETKNFKLKNGFLLTSNVKNIFQNGDLVFKDKSIKNLDILERFFALEIDGKYYKLFEHFDMGLDQENYGEEKIVPLDKTKYVPDNLYLVISYMKDEKTIVEKMKINSKKIFRNNRFINTKADSVKDKELDIVDINKLFDPFEYKKQLLKNGFREATSNERHKVYGLESALVKVDGTEEIFIDYVSYEMYYFVNTDVYEVIAVARNTDYNNMCEVQDTIGHTDLYIGLVNDDNVVYERMYDGCGDRILLSENFKGIDLNKIVNKYREVSRKYLYKEE